MGAEPQVVIDTIADLADVEAVEARGWPDDVPTSTYAMIRRSAARYPSAPALSFFDTPATHREPTTWTYPGLLGEITRAANAFHALGAGPTRRARQPGGVLTCRGIH